MTKRPEILHDSREVSYDESHWNTLRRLRKRTLEIMQQIESTGAKPLVHGSVARGDVTDSSDIDIIIPHTVSSYRLELVLGTLLHRELVQATPSMILKGHIHLEGDVVVSFPMFKLMSREEEFYRWGGALDSNAIQTESRIPGVDKRLILIEPTDTGHIEFGVIGHEHNVAKKLGVSIDIAQERVRVLTRREAVGRTGVYQTYHLKDAESFEEVTKRLHDSDPALRRTIERREGRRR
ncbi:MAG: nucleotidyltransferase domain-containing protein [Candidatus Thorarchaeota archaeon]|nr:nucleotidyltransferase domain-containing protein [Candidatus Thorarchaeota archaeon]